VLIYLASNPVRLLKYKTMIEFNVYTALSGYPIHYMVVNETFRQATECNVGSFQGHMREEK
jgi:hypothetical protein